MVVARVEDNQALAVDQEVDESVFVGDSVRPRVPGAVHELLGCADPVERVAQAGVTEQVDPCEDATIGRLQVSVVLPRMGVTDREHSVLPVEVVRLRGSVVGALGGVEQAAGVLGGAEHVDRLLLCHVLISVHEDRTSRAADDLDGVAVPLRWWCCLSTRATPQVQQAGDSSADRGRLDEDPRSGSAAAT